MSAARSTKFSNLPPINSASRAAPITSAASLGLYLCGERDFDPETRSFVRTLCLCLLYIPVFALRAYRVAPTEDGWSFLGRASVSTGARVCSTIAALALLGSGGYLGLDAYWNSPEVAAARNIAEADRLEAQGRGDLAAPLLGVVADGPSTKANLAQQRLFSMIAPTTKLAPQARRAALLVVVKLKKEGRWKGSASALHESAVVLAKELAGSDPGGAWLLLEALVALEPASEADAGLRRDLLEESRRRGPFGCRLDFATGRRP